MLLSDVPTLCEPKRSSEVAAVLWFDQQPHCSQLVSQVPLMGTIRLLH